MTGFEPALFGFEDRRLIHLGHTPRSWKDLLTFFINGVNIIEKDNKIDNFPSPMVHGCEKTHTRNNKNNNNNNNKNILHSVFVPTIFRWPQWKLKISKRLVEICFWIPSKFLQKGCEANKSKGIANLSRKDLMHIFRCEFSLRKCRSIENVHHE